MVKGARGSLISPYEVYSNVRRLSLRPHTSAAIQAALLGDFSTQPHPQESEPASEEEVLAWRSIASLALEQVDEVSLDEFAALTRASRDPIVVAHVAQACALLAVARGNVESLDRLQQLMLKFDDARPSQPLITRGLTLWKRWMNGEDAADICQQSQEVQRLAADAQLAPLVIESATLAALSACDAGDLGLALTLSRRASRMARAEELPQQEYLAHLALARVRRHVGHPALAARILAGLKASAAHIWSGWIAWETLVTAGVVVPTSAESGFARASHCFGESLAAAVAGDRSEMLIQLALADEVAAELAPVRSDLASARALLDVEVDPSQSTEELVQWLRGSGDGIPSQAYGTCVFESPERSGNVPPPVWISVQTGRRAARAGVLATGERMLSPGVHETSREEQLLAALSGGDKVIFRDAFRAVYGFEFVPDIHTSTFRVLIHRASKRLPKDAALTSEGDSLALRSEHPLWVVDPRCNVDTDAFVLGKLAQLRRASARDLAEALGLSIRTVQKALRRLQGGGACTAEKAGRNINYCVEDTTFEEASRHHRGVRDREFSS